MKKQFLFLAIALSFASFGAMAEGCTTEKGKSNSCTDGKVCCFAGIGAPSECVQPNSMGGCP